MCTIDRLHIKIKQKANKIDSNHNRDLPSAFIDDYIYESMFDYIELFWSTKNVKGLNVGFETNQQRIDFLSFLLQSSSLSSLPSSSEFGFIVNEFELPLDYLHLVRLTTPTNCRAAKFEVVQHEDLSTMLNDEYTKPSDKWGRKLAVIKNNKIRVYSESDTNTLNLEYIKKPRKPFFGGYNSLEFINGDTTQPSLTTAKIHPEFPEQYCDILADITVQNMFGNLRDYNYSQYNQNKTITKSF